MEVVFPSSFLWGASLSSYQTEGDNFNCDWYFWEKEKNLTPSNKASNHYNLFKEDFKLAKELNLNSLRISFEWSRLYPKKDEFNEKELLHYREVIDTLKSLSIKPVICLHHFTNPYWFYRQDGWLNLKNIDYFLKYLNNVVKNFLDVEYWLIFNEPLVYIYNGFISGIWPPGIKSFSCAKKAFLNIKTAYRIGYREIKNIYKDKISKISFSKHIRIFRPCRHFSFCLNNLNTFLRDRIFNFSILEDLVKYLDFIAINYYTKEYVHFSGLYGKECLEYNTNESKNSLGWYIYPSGLYEILIRLKRFNLPIMISENGTSEVKDYLYEDFFFSHLKSLARALNDKVNIFGYFWWSLIDNFEWDKGFGPRFGLIEVDYNNFERKIRNFAYKYAYVCKNNKLEI